MQSLSSKLLEKAVEQFASLPGIGRKTALRYVLHMLRQSPEEVKQFTDSITALKESIKEFPTVTSVTSVPIPNGIPRPYASWKTSRTSCPSKPPDNTTDFTMF